MVVRFTINDIHSQNKGLNSYKTNFIIIQLIENDKLRYCNITFN